MTPAWPFFTKGSVGMERGDSGTKVLRPPLFVLRIVDGLEGIVLGVDDDVLEPVAEDRLDGRFILRFGLDHVRHEPVNGARPAPMRTVSSPAMTVWTPFWYPSRLCSSSMREWRREFTQRGS